MEKRARMYLKKIESAPNLSFRDLKPSMLPSNTGGVYVIYEHTGVALYVGRTIDMRRRLYTNHLQGNESTARLKKYLRNDGTVSSLATAKAWIKENCFFRFIEISDYAERGKVEGLFSFFLNVKYIESEH